MYTNKGKWNIQTNFNVLKVAKYVFFDPIDLFEILLKDYFRGKLQDNQ